MTTTRQAKITCPHCKKPITVRDATAARIDWAAVDSLFKTANKFSADMGKAFKKVFKPASKP